MSEIAIEAANAPAADIVLPRAAPRSSRKEHPDIDSPIAWMASRLSVAASPWRSRRAMRLGRLAAERCKALALLSDEALTECRAGASAAMRADGVTAGTSVEALAIAGEMARRTLNLGPYAEQLACASALMRGAVAEMETGEGKTLAAYLAATAFGLAGRMVHVVTPNDYLAARDEQDLRPAYEALGLRTGLVIGGDSVQSRRKAYGADIVYVSSKEVVFDYLRDGLARASGGYNSALMAKLARAFGRSDGGDSQPLQRALDVAIVDEVDSVLVDEAGTPLLISTNRAGDIGEDTARQALRIAADFKLGLDFLVDPSESMPALTFGGLQRLEAETSELSGPWRVRLIREELIRAAIASQHILKRDHHYLVRDGKIVLIDQQSGRVTPDRHWSHGLSLMVEVREGCLSTGEKKSLASISFQRFFRGYSTICGMSGTVREVSAELHSVYGLKSAAVKRRLPLQRRHAPRRIFSDRESLWSAVARAAAVLHARGLPALVAVRSVGEADRASAALTALGVPHNVLSAAQDKTEAEIVAKAGQRGVITVVTNMAGRGTDIRLGEGVAELGGLVVLICERHDSRRVDRQLVGRCARQGDPGLVLEFVSLEDSALRFLAPAWRSLLMRWPQWTGLAISWSQHVSEQRNRNGRLQLLRRDEQLAKLMAFAGGLD
jgi:preprotein translocase subunit SecA